jgi:hypothetical protein
MQNMKKAGKAAVMNNCKLKFEEGLLANKHLRAFR